MERVVITLSLPQELAEEAKSAGLLTEEQLERWLQNELERQNKADKFFNKLDQLRSVAPPLTQEEIDREIGYADSFDDEEIAEMMTPTPISGKELVEWGIKSGAIGSWADKRIDDPVEWLAQQRAERRSRLQ